MTSTIDAAIWLRASTDHQDVEIQVPDLQKFAVHHAYHIVTRYEVADSAWNGGKEGGEYRATIQRALDDAHRGDFKVLIVWALDRLTREGAEGALRLVRQFRERGAIIVSVQESWLNGSPEVQDILLAFAGWRAQQESARRSERVKLGLARRKADGKPLGRLPGAKDARPRKRSGYVARQERERAARAASGPQPAPVRPPAPTP